MFQTIKYIGPFVYMEFFSECVVFIGVQFRYILGEKIILFINTFYRIRAGVITGIFADNERVSRKQIFVNSTFIFDDEISV